jgi:peptide/nickel transport system permease protein
MRAGPVLLALCVVGPCLLAPLLAAHPPGALGVAPPGSPAAVGLWLGADDLGRDAFSRLLHGGRLSLLVAGGAAAGAVLLGALAALAAAFGPRGLGVAVALGSDLLLALPRTVLLLAAVGASRAVGEHRLLLVAGLLALTGWMGPARVLGAAATALRGSGFVQAAVAAGLPPRAVLRVHVLPHLGPPLGVAAATTLGQTLLAEAALGFLGLGVPPPAVSWGTLLAEGRGRILQGDPAALAPGICIALTVLAAHAWADADAAARRASAPPPAA